MVEIAVAIIGLIGVVITVVVGLRNTRDSVTRQLELHQAVTTNEIEHVKDELQEMKIDIKEHNHYAKMFSETVPVVREQIKAINHRIDDLEDSGRRDSCSGRGA